MNTSWNEVSALAAKAARGAGAPPAQAVEFGRATALHLAKGRAEGDIRAALNALPSGPILDVPLALQTVLSDRKEQAAQGHVPAANQMDLVCSYIECLPFANTYQRGTDRVVITLDLTKPAPRVVPSRINLGLDLYYDMQTLAARTFVPETEASRLSGAGAGLTDND